MQVALLWFGERACASASLWSARGLDLDDADGFAAVGQAQPLTDGDQLLAVPEDDQTVGHLDRGSSQVADLCDAV